jgi:5-methylcytosine-specific restriction endonuclease McrA
MVSYESWELSVSDIRGKMDRGELKPDPDWQRGYIWKPKDEQLLIDSILRGVPIPKFYLTVEYDPKKQADIHYAVDGQQRLTAIHRFLSNKFPIELKGKQYFFKDLDSATQQSITTYKFNGHALKNYEQSDVNFLFQRLNRTGIKLTNMEEWNNEFFGSNVLTMVKDIQKEHEDFYVGIIYTEENIKRMLPLDDIIDLCNCLNNSSVQSGGKEELQSFLSNYRDISSSESSKLKSKFRKTLNNVEEIFTKQDLEASAYGKRTHFTSIFLAIGLLLPNYYILSNVKQLKNSLFNFIENQPDAYKESVLGAIRHKKKRETRVKLLQKVILRRAKELDENRLFDDALKQKFWRQYGHTCQICGKKISKYQDAVIDHIEPWAKGGETKESNAQLAHKRCNRRKRDKEEEFIIL